MGDGSKVDAKRWNEISETLTEYFQICSCQRKIKSIVDNLAEIKDKCERRDFNFTGAEWLLIAIMDARSHAVAHGINCEYPIIRSSDDFWQFIDSVKDDPNLEDN